VAGLKMAWGEERVQASGRAVEAAVAANWATMVR
jgi:hypothetical protein